MADTLTRLKRRADRSRWLIGALGLAIVLGLAWPWRDVVRGWVATRAGERPLMSVGSWHYQLDKFDLNRLKASPADLLVIDYAKAQGKVPLTPEDVRALKVRPDGRPRLVVAYMSIGEAEEFRSYWKPEWTSTKPSWLGAENCAWPQAHRVRFWDEGWRDLVYRGPDAYLKRIIKAGFDGVYLDRVDIYELYGTERPSARDDMIGFVADLARTARAVNPQFIVIPQNGDRLLASRTYRQAIDGMGKESLLYGVPGTGRRNSDYDIAVSARLLRTLAAESKPVFVVEYLQTAEAMADARAELTELGLVPTFEARALDGSDPLQPLVPTAKDPGSPEYVASSCAPGTAW